MSIGGFDFHNAVHTGKAGVPVPVVLPGVKGSLMKTGAPFAVVIPGVLTTAECEEWIRVTQNQGYEEALVNIGGGRQKFMPDVRKGARCMIDDQTMADTLFQRVKPHLPKTVGVDNDWHLKEANLRMRFLKYVPGDYFEPHFDGTYTDPATGDRSFVTMQCYLNEVGRGGSTRFICSEDHLVDVVPQAGSVLLFEHRLLHQGTKVAEGEKYAVRTDIMYARVAQ